MNEGVLPSPIFCLSSSDVTHLVIGAKLLGSGGGGDADLVGQLLSAEFGDAVLPIYAAEGVPESWSVTACGYIGGGMPMRERLPAGGELGRALAVVERWSGSTIGAVIGSEAGGMNTLAGPLAALEANLPYVDADLTGRAVPKLNQTTWAATGIGLTPAALSSGPGRTLIATEGSPEQFEDFARANLSHLGGWSAMALSPVSWGIAQSASISGSLAKALQMGRSHAALPRAARRSAIEARLGAKVLGHGVIREISRDIRAGHFGRGSVTIIDDRDNAVIRLEAENEFLAVLVDGEVVSTCPETICLLERDSSAPLSTEEIQRGQVVTVAVFEEPSWWRACDPRARRRVEPPAFGIEMAAKRSFA